MCLSCLNDGVIPEELNTTHIVLIFKKPKPERIFDLRPISLCNFIYKIIAKIMANRLKFVLPTVISKIKSAFVLRRLFLDNIMLAYEVNHYMKRKRQGKHGTVAPKVDMSKASHGMGVPRKYDDSSWFPFRLDWKDYGLQEIGTKKKKKCLGQSNQVEAFTKVTLSFPFCYFM